MMYYLSIWMDLSHCFTFITFKIVFCKDIVEYTNFIKLLK